MQRYAQGPREVGVFYYRFPHESRGHIFAITEKIFPSLTGDGDRTIAELILADPSASVYGEEISSTPEWTNRRSSRSGTELKLVEAEITPRAASSAMGAAFGHRSWRK